MSAGTRTNPIIVIATIAVTIFSVVGIATMTGLIPNSLSKSSSPSPLLTTAPEAAATTGLVPPAGAPAAVVANANPAASAANPLPAAPAPTVEAAPAGTPAPVTHDAKPARKAQHAPQVHANNAPTGAEPAAPAPAAPVCNTCATVDSVKVIALKGESSGVGAIAGGVLGAVLGHQIGKGNGNTAATVLGGAGGAYAGNEIEKNTKKTYRYDVHVTMDDGSARTLHLNHRPGVAAGQRVKVVGDSVVAQ